MKLFIKNRKVARFVLKELIVKEELGVRAVGVWYFREIGLQISITFELCFDYNTFYSAKVRLSTSVMAAAEYLKIFLFSEGFLNGGLRSFEINGSNFVKWLQT